MWMLQYLPPYRWSFLQAKKRIPAPEGQRAVVKQNKNRTKHNTWEGNTRERNQWPLTKLTTKQSPTQDEALHQETTSVNQTAHITHTHTRARAHYAAGWPRATRGSGWRGGSGRGPSGDDRPKRHRGRAWPHTVGVSLAAADGSAPSAPWPKTSEGCGAATREVTASLVTAAAGHLSWSPSG